MATSSSVMYLRTDSASRAYNVIYYPYHNYATISQVIQSKIAIKLLSEYTILEKI